MPNEEAAKDKRPGFCSILMHMVCDIYACSVQNFAEVVINFEEFPKNSMKFSKNSRILQKLKPKNSISGISKIFCYPECGQKKAALWCCCQAQVACFYVQTTLAFSQIHSSYTVVFKGSKSLRFQYHLRGQHD